MLRKKTLRKMMKPITKRSVKKAVRRIKKATGIKLPKRGSIKMRTSMPARSSNPYKKLKTKSSYSNPYKRMVKSGKRTKRAYK